MTISPRRRSASSTSYVNQSTKRKTAKILRFPLKTLQVLAEVAAERPGANLDAALLYRERFGWATFPARFDDDGRKYSYLSKDYSGGVNWGATDDPKKIARNYRKFKDAGVGVPCGPNDIFDIEVDTVAGHGKDGPAALRALERKHGKLPPTLTFVSPTGSVHRIYKRPAFPAGKIIKTSSSEIAEGVDGDRRHRYVCRAAELTARQGAISLGPRQRAYRQRAGVADRAGHRDRGVGRGFAERGTGCL